MSNNETRITSEIVTGGGKRPPNVPDTYHPNSIYESVNGEGKVRYRAFYDDQGRVFCRQDLQAKGQHKIPGAHEHNFSYQNQGRRTEIGHPRPLPSGYTDKPSAPLTRPGGGGGPHGGGSGGPHGGGGGGSGGPHGGGGGGFGGSLRGSLSSGLRLLGTIGTVMGVASAAQAASHGDYHGAAVSLGEVGGGLAGAYGGAAMGAAIGSVVPGIGTPSAASSEDWSEESPEPSLVAKLSTQPPMQSLAGALTAQALDRTEAATSVVLRFETSNPSAP